MAETRVGRLWALLALGALAEIAYVVFWARPFPLEQLVYVRYMDLGKLTQYSQQAGASFLASTFVLFLLYVIAVRVARSVGRDRSALALVLGFTLLFGITLGWMYPVTALDVFGYMFQGRILAHYHANPFIVPAADFPADPMLRFVAWEFEPSTYGPLWVLVSAIGALIGGSDLLIGTVFFKAVGVGLHLLTTLLIYQILRQQREESALAGAVFFAWNPLLIFETAGNGHNDVLMACLAVLAVGLMVRRRLALSLPVLMASAMVKFVTVLLFPVFLVSWLRESGGLRSRASALAWGLFLAGVVVVGLYLPFWEGPQTIGALRRGDLFTASPPACLFHWLQAWGYPQAGQLVRLVSVVCFAALALWRLWGIRDGARNLLTASFDILLMYLFTATWWFQPWYLVTLVPFAAAVVDEHRRRLALVFTASATLNYFVFIYVWLWYPDQLPLPLLQTLATLAIFGPPLAYLAWSWWSGRSARSVVESRTQLTGEVPEVTSSEQEGRRVVARVEMRGRLSSFWDQLTSRLTSGPALALAGVLVVGAAVRVIGLDSLEPNVMPDEADNLQVVYRILVGRGPGLAGLSWDGEPALSLYLMALCMHLFGVSIVAMRLGAVIPSLLSVVVLYLLARERLSVRASLVAAFLLSTSLWYLNFSRNAWTNVYVVLYTLVAAYAISLALRKERWWLYYGLAGLAVALGLHSYFAGRMIIVGLLIYLPVALIVFPEQRRRILVGYGIVVAVSVLLFLPQVPAMIADWDTYTSRTAATYIFAPSHGETSSIGDKVMILADQAQRNLRGFVLLDGSVIRGFRYSPPGEPLLDRLTAVLFLAGLALSLRHWRETSLWWCMAFAHVAGTQLLSAHTPDPARAIAAAPFYFLFVGLLFDRLFVRRTWYRGLFQLVVLALLPVIAFINVSGYVDWMRDPKTAEVRQPAVENWEFATWQELQLADAEAGKWGFTVNQWHQMRQSLNIPRPAVGEQPKPTPVPRVGATIYPPQTVTPSVSLVIDGRGLENGQLKEPNDVAVDTDGYIYVADTGNHRVQKFDRNGRFVARWGQLPTQSDGPGDGPLELVEPLGIVVDPDGNIVVLDSMTCWVKKYSPTGEYLGQWGGPSQAMYHPRGMTIDSQGNIWIADTGRCRVLKYSPEGELLTRIGPAIAGTYDMLEPVGVAFDADGNVYVTDVGNFRLLKFSGDLKLVAQWPLTSTVAARGHHLAVTSAQTLLATDPDQNRLLEFSRDGQVIRGWGGPGSGPGQFKRPVGVEVDRDDVYVADTFNNRVQRLSFGSSSLSVDLQQQTACLSALEPMCPCQNKALRCGARCRQNPPHLRTENLSFK